MIVRTMNENDLPVVLYIERVAWNDAAATKKQLLDRLRTFPEGSVVAETPDGKIVGYASAQLVDQISTKSWAEQTDNGCIISTHRCSGQIAYGVSMSGLPEGAKYSVGAHVIKHYYQVFIKTGRCSILCLGSRLPGFRRWKAKNSDDIKRYLSHKKSGLSQDPELRLYEKNGFQLMWEIEGYYPDSESLDYGVMVVRR